MPSIARTILLAVQVASFLALLGFSPATTTALASPLSGSSPALSANSPRSLLARAVSKHTDTELVARSPISSVVSTLQQRGSKTNTTQTVEKLHAYSAKMKANYETMQSLAAQNHPRSVSQAQWEAQCVSEMQSYQTNLDAFQALLVVLGLNAVCGCPLSLDDGLACYDPSSGLELILKDTINTSKNILSVTAALTQNIPLLGPLVDDIKCILDEVLDAVENLTDCLLDITSKAVIALGLGDLVKGLLPGLLPGLR